MVLLIDPSDIAQIELTPLEVITAVESAYRQDGIGMAEETPRLEIKIKGKELPHIAPGTTSVGHGMAYLEESNVFITSYSYHFDFHKYINQILDPETGKTLAVVKRVRGAFGTKPNSSMAARTFARVFSLTRSGEFNTRETVAMLRPANSATSYIVGEAFDVFITVVSAFMKALTTVA